MVDSSDSNAGVPPVFPFNWPGLGPGIYVHIPFCISKCAYCDFASYPIGELGHDEVAQYISALIAEARMRSEASVLKPKTLYLGGGTPSILSSDEISLLFNNIRERFGCCGLVETTIEANPDTLTKDKLSTYQKLGITRLSIGIQSLSIETLSFLGRTYTPERALSTLSSLRADLNSFSLSFDLLICIPKEQPPMQVVEDIRKLLTFAPDHFSIYALKLEPGTPLAKRLEGNLQAVAAEERYADEMKLVEDTLAAEGFVRYEISNFARNERWSLHNLNYWNFGDYIGLGLNASGHIAGRRWRNHRKLNDYLRAVESGEMPEAESEVLTPDQRTFERIMLALRTRWGLQQAAVPPEIWRGIYANALTLNDRLPGLLAITPDSIAPTSAGMNVEHSLVLELIEGVL